MVQKVIFREFEERDAEFVCKTKAEPHFFDLAVGESNVLSYEESVSWVQGSKNSDDTYKYWAICSDDSEQRIVGWCGISNIDYRNKSAYFHTIVINDKDYKGGAVVNATHRFIMQYVFEVLKLNRLYSSFLAENEFQYKTSQMVFNCVEGVMKQAVYKNGTYHDLVIAAIIKKEYFEHKNNGDFELENILQKIMDDTSSNSDSESVESFLDFIASSLEETNRSEIQPQTKFRDLPEWSSLTALLVISAINEKYKVALNEEELVSSETFEDVYNAIISKL